MYKTQMKVYSVWRTMKQRCDNQNSVGYANWGGRGITYCDKWKTFDGFWEDMQDGYEEGLTLDRIDFNGNYCKENCRWATYTVQLHNKRHRNKHGYKGISEKNGTYYANITKYGEYIYLGRYASVEDAATAYDNASYELYGDRPNGTLYSVPDQYFKLNKDGFFGVSKTKNNGFRARYTDSNGVRHDVGTYATSTDACISVDNYYEDCYGTRPNKTQRVFVNKQTPPMVGKIGSTGFTGVVKTLKGRYQANVRGKYLGTFDDPLEAAIVVDDRFEELTKVRPNGTDRVACIVD